MLFVFSLDLNYIDNDILDYIPTSSSPIGVMDICDIMI